MVMPAARMTEAALQQAKELAKPFKVDGEDKSFISLLASGFLRTLGGTHQKFVGLRSEDPDYQAIVQWLREKLGPDVVIDHDFPSIHTMCGLDLTGAGKDAEKLDGDMKAAMVIVVKQVQNAMATNTPNGYISWEKLRLLFEGEELRMVFVPWENPEFKDFYMKDYAIADINGFHTWKTDNKTIREAIHAIRDCVPNEVIWNELRIDTNKLAEVLGTVHITPRDAVEFFARQRSEARIAIDVGVVRMPCSENPYFKLYRYRVISFNKRNTVLGWKEIERGLYCHLQVKHYKVTEEFKRQYMTKSEEAKIEIQQQYDDLFAFAASPSR